VTDTAVQITTKKDWVSEREVRWCPGCGDYGVMHAVQGLMPELGISPDNTVFISGIGCSSRFPYYMNTYGMHSIHGRAPAIATGLAVARPDLDVWVVTGDGDGLSIGGNHLIHALRRNVNLTILLFNNRIYGLTKGQYSPTSDAGMVTPTSPEGAIDRPVPPLGLAIAAGATFVARGYPGELRHLIWLIREALQHPGYALVDVLQPCVTFNRVNTYAWYRERVYDLAKEEGYDASDRTAAWQKAQEWGERIPLGVIYQVEGVPIYEDQVRALKGGSPVSRLRELARAPTLDRYESLKERFV